MQWLVELYIIKMHGTGVKTTSTCYKFNVAIRFDLKGSSSGILCHCNFYTVYFHTAIVSLIVQPTARVQLNIWYRLLNICHMFRRSLSHPQGEKLSLPKTICLLCVFIWETKDIMATRCSVNQIV